MTSFPGCSACSRHATQVSQRQADLAATARLMNRRNLSQQATEKIQARLAEQRRRRDIARDAWLTHSSEHGSEGAA